MGIELMPKSCPAELVAGQSRDKETQGATKVKDKEKARTLEKGAL